MPGSAFGDMGEGYLRLVFANSDENLKEAVRRIADYVARADPGITYASWSAVRCPGAGSGRC